MEKDKDLFTAGSSEWDESEHPRDELGRFTEKDKAAKTVNVNSMRKLNIMPNENRSTIKEQVTANLIRISETSPLMDIPASEATNNFYALAKRVEKMLSESGGYVERKGFGMVQVGRRIKKAGKYITTQAEKVALLSIPNVIMRGVKIAEHANHKDRRYPTYTFAGKVTISGKSGIVAVVVTETSEKFYKVHRVLTPDGKTFEI